MTEHHHDRAIDTQQQELKEEEEEVVVEEEGSRVQRGPISLREISSICLTRSRFCERSGMRCTPSSVYPLQIYLVFVYDFGPVVMGRLM